MAWGGRWGGRWSGGWFGLLAELDVVTPGPINEERAREAMTAHWLAAWSSTPSALDNETFESVGLWSRFSIVHSTRQQVTMGAARRYEAGGRIAVQVFGAVNQGSAQVAALSDEVRIALEGASIPVPGDTERIATYEGATIDLGTDGAWHMAVVVVPFRYVETR